MSMSLKSTAILSLVLVIACLTSSDAATTTVPAPVVEFIKDTNVKLHNEMEDLVDDKLALLSTDLANVKAELANAKATASTELANVKTELANVKATASTELAMANVKAELANVKAAATKNYKRLRDENVLLREKIASSGTSIDEDAIMLLVTKLLEKHKRNTYSLEARIDSIESTQVSKWNERSPDDKEGNTHLTTRRHLAQVDTSVLEDAALWMQAKNAKILFGASADTNLYRSEEDELTTDSNVVIKKDLNVQGENWHLTTMMTAKENVTVGSVISLCGGKACVGYGLASTGFRGSNNAATDLKVIHLGGADSLAVMYYRKWVATSHQSQPMMRLVKPLHSVTRDYSGDPIMGDEIPVLTGTVSELRMAPITETSFIMLYRKQGASTTKTIQGAVRLGELTSVNDNTLAAADEVPIALIGGYGFKRGIPIRLGDTKFAIAWEHTDVDTGGNWMGTGSIAMGTIGGGSAGNRGVAIGGGLEFGKYVSDLNGASFNDNKNVVLVYREQNALKTVDRGVAVLVDTVSSIAKIVTTVVFNPESSRFMDIVMISQKAMVVVYREPKRNFIGKGMLLKLIQQDTQLLLSTPVEVADESSIENSYALSVTLIQDGQLALAYRNGAGRPRLVDCDVVGTSIVVGTPRVFAPEDHISSSYQVVGLTGTAFMLAFQDNEANLPNVATALVGSTYGGALRTGVATSAGVEGEQVQVAIEGAITVPIGAIIVNGASITMEPGARYYGKYDGGISPSSDAGVLLGRALRADLLLLERDFAGGFRIDKSGTATSGTFVGEIKALAGATVPAGWLKCDGSAVSRVDYSSLFAGIGVTWGNGDGTSTFNVPDLRGRTVIGAGQATNAGSVPSTKFTNAEATNHPLGQYDGAERFRMTLPSRVAPTLATATQHVDYHSADVYVIKTANFNPGSFTPGSISTKTGTTSTSSTQSSNTDGVGFAQINMMPYAAVTYIIKT